MVLISNSGPPCNVEELLQVIYNAAIQLPVVPPRLVPIVLNEKRTQGMKRGRFDDDGGRPGKMYRSDHQ
jgi:hypothetical protein